MDKKRKGIFFTSDWHIGHANVIIFDKRPFKTLDEMDEALISRYNATVTKNSVCYFLGDMGWGKDKRLATVMGRLNGTKVLLLGNHDRNTYSMYDQGFDVVLNTATFYIGEHQVSMSHCPLPGIVREDIYESHCDNARTLMKGAKPGECWHGEFKNRRFSYSNSHATFHLHGHIHSDGKVKPRSTDMQYDVGVRANNYTPVSISTIESWIHLSLKDASKS